MTRKINWMEKRVRLSSLRPYEKNPRFITDAQFERLKASLAAPEGQFKPLLATVDGLLIGGHQRIRAMRDLGWEECRIWQADRELEKKEYDRIMLSDNHNNGQFDLEMLANEYELDFLQGIGLHEVMNVAPEDAAEEGGKKMVRCPDCSHEFPVKGNGVKK